MDSLLTYLYKAAHDAGVSPSLSVMILLFLLVAAWLASGFYAADIAEHKNMNRLGAFVMGLLGPWIYPLVLASKTSESEEWALTAIPAAPPDAEETKDLPAVVIEEAKESNDETRVINIMSFNQKYFACLIGNSKVPLNGSFTIVMVDGNALSVSTLAEALPNVLVVDSPCGEGKTKRLRIPYQSIKDFGESV